MGVDWIEVTEDTAVELVDKRCFHTRRKILTIWAAVSF